MATLKLSGALAALAGCEEIEVSATAYRGLLHEIDSILPEWDRAKIESMAFVIDGEIVDEPFLATFASDSELHFIEKIAAG